MNPPLVHAVKTGSILDGKVQVGDLLMAVDDQNVTEVSKFIAARSNRRRTLVFWHQNPRKRTEASIMLKGDGV
jgi:PDZ domain-containing secreted protein